MSSLIASCALRRAFFTVERSAVEKLRVAFASATATGSPVSWTITVTLPTLSRIRGTKVVPTGPAVPVRVRSWDGWGAAVATVGTASASAAVTTRMRRRGNKSADLSVATGVVRASGPSCETYGPPESASTIPGIHGPGVRKAGMPGQECVARRMLVS